MTRFKFFSQIVAVAVLLSACVKAEKHQAPQNGPKSFRLSRSGPEISVEGYTNNQISSNDIDLRSTRNVDVISKFANYTNKREYEFKMCGLQDVRGGGNIIGQKFDIYSELDIRTRDGGHTATVEVSGGSNCIYWTATMPFNIMGDSINLEIDFVFKTEAGVKNYIHRKVLLNPWDARRGENPEFLDFTNSGLSPKLREMPWARGVDEINQALAGTLIHTKKKLEIGSVNIVPVKKNKENFIETNLIGASVDENMDQKIANEQIRLKMADGVKLQTLDLHLNIRLDNLKVRLFDTAGVNNDMALTTGRYRIFAQLFATDVNTKGHFILTDKLPLNEEVVWKTNTMGVNAVLPVSLVIRPQWGNLALALKVVPVDVPGIEPFEGLYHLGQFNELAGGKSPLFDLSEYTLDKESNAIFFSYDDYQKKSMNYADWQKGLGENAANSVSTFEKGFRQFMFTGLNVLFSRVMPGDTATDRTIQYTVETCVVNTFTGEKPGKGLVFDIETEDKGHKFVIRRQTNDLGCLSWVGMISHKVYNRENLIRKISKLTYLGDDAKRPTFEIDYYINPWDEKFTFGRDSRILPKEYLDQIASQQKVAPPTRVFIADFRYDATSFRYSIDKYMNLTVKKTVNMILKPRILKYNSIVWGRSGLGELRDGIYLLKVAMQKDYLDPAAPGRKITFNTSSGHYRLDYNGENLEKKQFLVVKELLVRVLGGEIITPIEFDVTDLRTLRIRAQMLIQIETIDEMLLRAVVLADNKLNNLITKNNSQTTLQIMDLQASEDKINKALEQLDKSAKESELYDKLIKDKNDIKEKLLTVLSTLDEESLKKVLAQIDSIRNMGETNVSIDRNIKYQTLNQTLRQMRAKLQMAEVKKEENVRRQYVKNQEDECRHMMNRLINQGREEEAKLFDPTTNATSSGQPGSLCIKDIPADQIFYHLTTANDIGSEAWLKTLFSKEEFELYQNNQLRDDFTKPYLPDYDFNLLSNQGDELLDENGNPREAVDTTVSGLSRRTFIGPVTFVLNGNGSAMRPTDVLDESSCNGTCEQLKEIEFTEANQSELKGEIIKRFGLPENASYEENPYFGYVGQFYKKQVNDLVPIYRGLRYQYHQEMKAFSQVGNFLDQLALSYVSFAAKPEAVKTLNYACYTNWKNENEKIYSKWQTGEDKSYEQSPLPENCFEPNGRVVSSKEFFKKGTQGRKAWFFGYNWEMPTTEDWIKFSKNGLLAKLSLETKENALHSMCLVMRYNFLDPQNKNELTKIKGLSRARVNARQPGVGSYTEQIDNIESQCHKLVGKFFKNVRSDLSSNKQIDESSLLMARAKELPFIIDRKVRVIETSNRYIYKDGKTLNYSVSENFSLGHSQNVNRGYKLDPGEAVEKTLGAIGSIAVGAAVGGPVGAGAAAIAYAAGGSKILGSVSGMLNFQWGTNESQSRNDGTSVSVGTTLSAQISTLDIEISKWEKCVVLRFDDKFLKDNVLGDYGPFFNASWALKNLGNMLCSGQKDTVDDLASQKDQPLRVREKYYYLTQIFNEGDMQDPGSLLNHPWMLQLRGARDFFVFENALKLPPKDISWLDPIWLMKNDMASLLQGTSDQQHNDRSSLEVVSPQDSMKALNMMQEAFERALPTFPGLYTFSEAADGDVVGWPSEMSGSPKTEHGR